jgi:hypothetical protein
LVVQHHYTQQVDFAQIKSELQLMEKNDLAMLKAENDRLMNDIEKLKQRLREEITRTKAGVLLDLNLEKGRMREESSGQELKIKEVDTRIEQEIAGLRTAIQASKVLFWQSNCTSCLMIFYLGNDLAISGWLWSVISNIFRQLLILVCSDWLLCSAHGLSEIPRISSHCLLSSCLPLRLLLSTNVGNFQKGISLIATADGPIRTYQPLLGAILAYYQVL